MAKIIWLNQHLVKKHSAVQHWSLDFVWNQPAFLGVKYWTDRFDPDLNHPSLLLPTWCGTPNLPRQISMTFEAATEQRAQHFMQMLKDNPNDQLVVLWSGGIDSTMALAAIIQYFPADLRARVSVALSGASIFENPYFYRDHVIGQFTVIDLEHHVLTGENIIQITGGAGDKLLHNELLIKWAVENPGDQSINKNKTKLAVWMGNAIGRRDTAMNIVERVLLSGQRHGVQIDTVADFMFWLGFNFGWVGQTLDKWSGLKQQPDVQGNASGRNVSWFNSDAYQTWAMQQSGRWSHGSDWWHEYKRPFKDFIYRLDGNEFFRNFKQKTPSVAKLQRNGDMSVTSRLAVFEDGSSVLYDPRTVDRDLADLGWL